MKAVILAGGKGTRLYEETKYKPKPLVEIGKYPILWHIMKIYSMYGINDFVICCGYKGNLIREYFLNNFSSVIKFTSAEELTLILHVNEQTTWHVSLIDTGLETMTGGRLQRVKKLLGDGTFFFTYGDTLSDVNVSDLLLFHQKHGCLATVTACNPPDKYGILTIEGNLVKEFREKPPLDNVWVNGGFFVLESGIFNYIKNDDTSWESDSMSHLANDGKLYAYLHDGFYQPMDTMKDKLHLNELWDSKTPPWKIHE